MSFGPGGGGGLRADINITPLVDVVLVLLIIFMVVTPMLQRGKSVELPKAKHAAVNKAENDCIGHFATHVSEKTRAGLHDPVRVMPFANLEFPKGNPKNHGIRGARAPRIKRGAKPPMTAAAPAAPG